MEKPDVQFLPGDIAVTPVPQGLMVGRAMAGSASGQSWECVKVLTYYEDAVELACELAARESTRAWFHKNHNEFDRIR